MDMIDQKDEVLIKAELPGVIKRRIFASQFRVIPSLSKANGKDRE